MRQKFFATVAVLVILTATLCDPVFAGALEVGGGAYTNYEYGASQGKDEASVERVHGGSFKIGLRLKPRSHLTISGDSKVGYKSSKTKMGGLFFYDLGYGWNLHLSDDYIWIVEQLNPENDTLSQVFKASITGKILNEVGLTIAYKWSRENFPNRMEKNGIQRKISVDALWRAPADIFVKAKLLSKSSDYAHEQWRDYVEGTAEVSVEIPLGDNINQTLKGEIFQKSYPHGDRYHPYQKLSLASKLKWKVNDELTVIFSSELINNVVRTRTSSNYLKKTLKAETRRKFGKNITMNLQVGITQKDFPNTNWGSSDYSQRFYGINIKNKLLSDLTFNLQFQHSDTRYLKKDSPLEKKNSLALDLEKLLSEKTELNLGLERVIKSVKGEPTSDTLLNAKVCYDISDDMKSIISCSHSTQENDTKIRAEIKYSFK